MLNPIHSGAGAVPCTSQLLLLCPTVLNGWLVQAVGILSALAAAGRAEGSGADSQSGGACPDVSARFRRPSAHGTVISSSAAAADATAAAVAAAFCVVVVACAASVGLLLTRYAPLIMPPRGPRLAPNADNLSIIIAVARVA